MCLEMTAEEDRVGGGDCIFVLMATGIDSNVLHFDQSLFSNVELIGCELKICSTRLIVLGVYAAPNILPKRTFL